MRLASLAPLALVACVAPASHEPYVLQAGQIDFSRGPDGNTVIFDTAEGLLVVDTGRHPEHVQAILDHAKKVGKPVAVFANTHWHMDHSTGNHDLHTAWPEARLVATGAMAGALGGFLAPGIVRARQMVADPETPADARARVQRFLAAIDDRAAIVPDDPVTEDRTLELGGRTFELHVAHAAATEDDLWLTVPDEKLAVVGDLVVAPVPFFDTACEEGWRKALDTIDAAEWDTLIPGHGTPMTRAEFTRWRTAFGTWLDCAASDSPAADCAEAWMKDASGFYTAGEKDDVRMAAEEYVSAVLRAPASERMAYCS